MLAAYRRLNTLTFLTLAPAMLALLTSLLPSSASSLISRVAEEPRMIEMDAASAADPSILVVLTGSGASRSPDPPAGFLVFTETAWEQSMERLIARWHPEMKLVITDATKRSEEAARVAKRLRKELDHEEVYVVAGGLK